jgi:hypothetical protein
LKSTLNILLICQKTVFEIASCIFQYPYITLLYFYIAIFKCIVLSSLVCCIAILRKVHLGFLYNRSYHLSTSSLSIICPDNRDFLGVLQSLYIFIIPLCYSHRCRVYLIVVLFSHSYYLFPLNFALPIKPKF